MGSTVIAGTRLHRYIPIRPPFLLPTSVEIPEGVTAENFSVGGISAIGTMQVLLRHCVGHVEGFLVFPGVLREELLNQVLGIGAGFLLGLPEEYVILLRKTGEKTTSKPAFPGDVLRAEVSITKLDRRLSVGAGKVFVVGSGDLVCSVSAIYGSALPRAELLTMFPQANAAQAATATATELVLAQIGQADDKMAELARLLGLPADAVPALLQALGLLHIEEPPIRIGDV